MKQLRPGAVAPGRIVEPIDPARSVAAGVDDREEVALPEELRLRRLRVRADRLRGGEHLAERGVRDRIAVRVDEVGRQEPPVGEVQPRGEQLAVEPVDGLGRLLRLLEVGDGR